MEFINDLNLKKQADNLGVKIWQTPGFLFIIMGIVASFIMTGTYFISKDYDDPETLVLMESAVAVTIIVIGNGVVSVVEQVAKLNKSKSEFVSVASHQLRTPLSAIRWETELLLTKLRRGLNEKQLEYIRSISEQGEKMARLVNDLLDVARIDQKRLVLRRIPVDLEKIAENLAASFVPIAKAKGVELIFSPVKRIPRVVGDPERLRMVTENILGNAVKYTVSGGKIEMKIVKKDRSVVFSVKDNGVGIPKQQHGRVYDKFFRSDNIVKYQTEGTGLGLYISKNIIEQLGGKIWFESVENLGTIFSFSLPISHHKESPQREFKKERGFIG